MVRVLIRMRAAMLANRGATRFAVVSTIVSAVLGLLTAVGTLLIGFRHYSSVQGATDVVAVTMAVWVIGRIGYAAFAGGDASLRFELFRMLPVSRTVLARALLAVGLLDPGGVVLAIAFGALVAAGARYGAGPAVVGALGLVLTVLVVNVLATVVGAVNPQGARRTRDFGTVLVAVVISLVAVAGTTLPALSAAVQDGTSPAVAWTARILPSGWAADAVRGAAAGNMLETIAPLAGLLLLGGGLVLLWPAVLGRRLDGRAGGRRAARIRRTPNTLLPQTPTGAVVAKELRFWLRDPIRVTLLMIGAIVGLGACVIPAVTHGTERLMPFAGVLTIVIAVAGAANLYGADGPALRLTILAPAGPATDVRGRQLAWLLIVGPYVLVLGVLLTAVGGQSWAWPWMLAATLAILGGGLGLFPLASVISVQTLDDHGGLTPGWVIKAYATLLLTPLTAAPAAGLLIVGAVAGSPVLSWLAVPVAAGTGAALALGLGRVATRRLEARQFDILATIVGDSSPAVA
ncbi:hypothetical protein GCM10023322_38210 [Rugosimonospora acidiphila]|uniref:ABC-2 type transport system permease protein n=1 Tax=Rugosimonospora acidiphila TaxID=556531 RepID=A0ABP9RX98_9ACTN